ncbi:GAF domain-containing protein [Actinokineospora sp.]|uniref:GAF domain-containing protein n=1 Tax=Actinokineospora sp. TaxID=1872133 RepID=UPI0040378B17
MSHPTDFGTARETRLLHAFVDLADTLVDDYDVVDVLHQLVENCVDLLDAAAAGLLLSDQRGGLLPVASTSEQTRRLELFQLEADEGPCLDCFRTGEPVVVADLAAATDRWPRFAAHAAAEGFRSVHAVPLRLRGSTIGALNLFGTQAGPMDDQDLRVARALADTATIGILQERAIRRGEVLTEQLQTALNNRITIEQAKGVLAHAGDIDMNQAFQRLRSYGRATSTRLSEIAHRLVTGELPPKVILDHR